jgi:hypothetical protein
MKGIFWKTKPRFLFDASNDHNLDFIALFETRRKSYSEAELSTFCRSREFFFDNGALLEADQEVFF